MNYQQQNHERVTLHFVFGAGVFIWILLVWILLLGSSYQYEVPNSERPILLVTSLFIAASIISIAAIWLGLRIPNPNRTLLWAIIVFSISFRLVQLFAPPFQEVDSYRYVWDGITTTSGVSPYRYSPQQVLQGEKLKGDGHESAEFNTLQENALKSHAITTILSRVHFAKLKTIYPPISQAVFAVSVLLVPENASVSTYLVAMKFSITLFDLGTFFLLLYLLSLLRVHYAWSMVYGWNPLVIKEFSNSGHLDSIAIFLVMLSAIFFLKSIQSFHAHHGQFKQSRYHFLTLILSAVFLAFGFGAKIYPIILVPYFLVVLLKNSSVFNSLLFGFVFTLVSIVVLFPMFREFGENEKSKPQSAVESSEIQAPKEGLTVFLKHWQINEWAFMLVYQNLREIDPQQELDVPWFRIQNEFIRKKIVGAGQFFVPANDAVNFVSRLITLGCFGLIYLGILISIWRQKKWTAESFLAGCFWIIAVFFCLQPTQNPWYWIWAVPFLPFTQNRGWLIYSPLLLIYYFRFWFALLPGEFSFFGFSYTGMGYFDYVVVWLEHLPTFLLVAFWFPIRRYLPSPLLKKTVRT